MKAEFLDFEHIFYLLTGSITNVVTATWASFLIYFIQKRKLTGNNTKTFQEIMACVELASSFANLVKIREFRAESYNTLKTVTKSCK